MTDDNKIIDLFFQRSEQAIAQLSKKYGSSCKYISKNILKNDRDAEECVNDTYLAVWNTIPPKNPNPLKAYVFRIVRNISVAKYHANTALKRNSYYDVALDELESCLTSPSTIESEIDAIELSKHLDNFLDSIDKNSRLMFMCRYWYCQSISDIAKQFGTSNHNVSVRLSRIREKLKNYLLKEGFKI